MTSKIPYAPMNHIQAYWKSRKVLHTENEFSFAHVNRSDVQKIMESLNSRKTHGFDGMPAELLKLFAPVLAGEHSRLINDPIDTCLFSAMFKLAVVSSQFKKLIIWSKQL